MSESEVAAAVVATSSCDLVTRFGHFTATAYRLSGGLEHIALVLGDLRSISSPLIRIQSSCVTSTALGAMSCDCAAQVELAMALIVREEGGALLYLAQEGAGHGLVEKVRQMNIASTGGDLEKALRDSGTPLDPRRYGDAAAIIRDLTGGSGPIRLVTNNPTKFAGVSAVGISMAERVPIEVEGRDDLSTYLAFKKRVLGHILTKV